MTPCSEVIQDLPSAISPHLLSKVWSRRSLCFQRAQADPRLQRPFLPQPEADLSSVLSQVSSGPRDVLEEAAVVVAPGIGFGTSGEGYVRLGLLTDEERLKEAIYRIGKLGLFRTQ